MILLSRKESIAVDSSPFGICSVLVRNGVLPAAQCLFPSVIWMVWWFKVCEGNSGLCAHSGVSPLHIGWGHMEAPVFANSAQLRPPPAAALSFNPPLPRPCQLKLAPLGSSTLSPLRWRANPRGSSGQGFVDKGRYGPSPSQHTPVGVPAV